MPFLPALFGAGKSLVGAHNKAKGGAEGGAYGEESKRLQEKYTPQSDSRLDAIADMQAKQAKGFRERLGATQASRFDTEADPARRDIAERMAGVKKNYASRGLLYSGLKQGAQAGEAQGGASELANLRGNVNAQTLQEADQMDASAMNTGMQAQQQRAAAQKEAYNNYLQDKVQGQKTKEDKKFLGLF